MDFIEVTGKTVDDALTEGLVQLGATSDQVEYEVIDKGSTGFLGFNSKPARIKIRKKNTPEDRIREFLEKVFSAMQMEVEIVIKKAEEENVFDVELKGDDMGILIGKRGQTLDSLQYLTNLAINKHADEYIKIKLDTEDYRDRRKETLENLAKNISYKVRHSHRPVSLEPMNPFERRVIHSALQNDRYVTTHSEGDEPYRHVVVTLKKDAELDDSYENGYGGGYKKKNYHKKYNSYGKRGYGKSDYNKRGYEKRDYEKRDYEKGGYGKRDYGKRDYNKNDYERRDYGNRAEQSENYEAPVQQENSGGEE